MAIRILHVVNSLGVGGMENGLVNVIRQMDPRRFTHAVCAMRELGPMADRLPRDRVQVMCLEEKDINRTIQVGPLVQKIREIRPDIVHSRNWGGIEAVIAGRWARSCAVIHSEHGMEFNTSRSEPWRRSCFRRLAFELADRVFSVSHQLRDLHARRTGFPARKISVIYNGVDSRKFSPDPSARSRSRQELAISPEEFCIGWVGRLDPIKDLPTLLRAVEAFSKSCANWRLLIVGDGSELPSLEAFVRQSPVLSGRVNFLGLRQRVPEILNAMDVFVLPSISEGISNTLLEAMATGLPVVASAAGGNPEVVVEGESGFLFSVGDHRQLAEKILLLWKQSSFRRRLGEQALQRVKDQFSPELMVQQYERLYSSLAQARAA